jgi:hypothetical protein
MRQRGVALLRREDARGAGDGDRPADGRAGACTVLGHRPAA